MPIDRQIQTETERRTDSDHFGASLTDLLHADEVHRSVGLAANDANALRDAKQLGYGAGGEERTSAVEHLGNTNLWVPMKYQHNTPQEKWTSAIELPESTGVWGNVRVHP